LPHQTFPYANVCIYKKPVQPTPGYVQTDNDFKPITIEPKATGYGSSINGGELLLLALATCFCNDIYR